MLQLAGGIQRIRIDHDHADAQRGEQRDRVLQDVWQHDGQPIALPEPCHLLQPGGKAARQVIELAIGERAAHLHVRG